jgi:hypothetical protein
MPPARPRRVERGIVQRRGCSCEPYRLLESACRDSRRAYDLGYGWPAHLPGPPRSKEQKKRRKAG